MLVKGAPVFNNLVLFQLMTDGLKGTKPLITCNHKHFKQIDSKIQIIISHCNFNMLKILQKSSIKIVFFFMKDYFHQAYLFESYEIWAVCCAS